MLSLSQTTGYAIKALCCLDKTGEERTLVKDLAEQTGIPKPYLSKILLDLTRAGLVVSKRGYHGGIALSRPAEQITLMDIVEVIGRHDWERTCLLGMKGCSTEECRCPMHSFWVPVYDKIEKKLRSVTLADVDEFTTPVLPDPQPEKVPAKKPAASRRKRESVVARAG